MDPISSYDLLNITINWDNIAKALEDDHWKQDVVMDLPPVNDNEDFWQTSTGASFAGGIQERQKTDYKYGLMVGSSSGDTFQIVPMQGKKPKTQ